MPEYHLFRSMAERDYKCPYADIPFNDDVSVRSIRSFNP